MNKLYKWFVGRAERNLTQELDANGLEIKDANKFYEYKKKLAKKDMIYTLIMVILLIFIIYRWFTGG